MTESSRPKWAFVVGTLAALTLTGCASLADVVLFARSARQIAESSDEYLRIVRESDIDLAAATALSDYDSFAEAESPHRQRLEALKRLHAATESLGGYAKALEKLATFDDSDSIQAASIELAGNLDSLAETLGAADKAPEASVLAGAIRALGNAYIHLKKQTGLRHAISEAQPYVSRILDALGSEVARQANQSQNIRATVDATISETDLEAWMGRYQELDKEIQALAQQLAPNPGPLETERIQTRLGAMLLERAGLRSLADPVIRRRLSRLDLAAREETFLTSLSGAIRTCKAAHDDLASSELNLDSAGELAKKVGELAKAVRDLAK